jgi:hypothetical protein
MSDVTEWIRGSLASRRESIQLLPGARIDDERMWSTSGSLRWGRVLTHRQRDPLEVLEGASVEDAAAGDRFPS